MLQNTAYQEQYIDLSSAPWTMHEFFAGSGLVAYGLKGMFAPVWANDISDQKAAVYSANFGGKHFVLDDIKNVNGAKLPYANMSWASFPCQDLSLAEKRSEIMRQVKSKKNKSTELRLIEIFKQNGITGWRRNYPIKGHPDFVFLKQKIAVFVDGCFWRGHDCRNTRPSDHQEYWQKKQERNMKHDQEVTAMFEARGWSVLRIWECELKKTNGAQISKRLLFELQRMESK